MLLGGIKFFLNFFKFFFQFSFARTNHLNSWDNFPCNLERSGLRTNGFVQYSVTHAEGVVGRKGSR